MGMDGRRRKGSEALKFARRVNVLKHVRSLVLVNEEACNFELSWSCTSLPVSQKSVASCSFAWPKPPDKLKLLCSGIVNEKTL